MPLPIISMWVGGGGPVGRLGMQFRAFPKSNYVPVWLTLLVGVHVSIPPRVRLVARRRTRKVLVFATGFVENNFRHVCALCGS